MNFSRRAFSAAGLGYNGAANASLFARPRVLMKTLLTILEWSIGAACAAAAAVYIAQGLMLQMA
jgi:hypothetical protein